MIIRVANPIYDSVFKYLVEDPRIAKTLISVYLLGHKVGNIKEPIIYATHKAYDYNGNEVTDGMPDPFVESLVHDSIIVQIPRLHGNVNNRLEKVLSVFDQTRKDASNRQVLNIEEDNYEDDSDMMYILRRLLSAASDAKLRQDMNVEDEYFTAIENRDTAIMNRDRRIAEQKVQIAEQGQQLAEQGQQLAAQGQQLAEQKKALRATILALADRGMSVPDIALVIGKTEKQVKEIIG